MSKKRNRKKQSSSKSGKNRTPISGHARKGSELVPPFANMEKITLTSWMNDRLPEMLWASLILASTDRDFALRQFRRLINFIGNHDTRGSLFDVTLTGISKLEPSLREEVISYLVEPPEVAQSLATLLIFESLPARESWNELLPSKPPDVELLMGAVGRALWHQSQEATDCRWMRLIAWVASGSFHIPEEMAKQWFGYPNEGDQDKVRGLIRAAEISLDSYDPSTPPDLTWPHAFWDEAWKNTSCLALVGRPGQPPGEEIVTRQRINKVLESLHDHWATTHTTTAIDVKHDGVFGMAFYALRILEDLMGIGIGTSILGRLGLRTISEVRINLHYLLSKDDGSLWKTWREYGAGQAKLNALKFDDNVDPPAHIDKESIELIAGEDIWEEFLSINVSSWSGKDLRRLSELSNLKDVYDRHFSWTSGYAHGMWGPIRESGYEICGNPLHRLHRYPQRGTLPDTVNDAATLVDDILGELDRTFPVFPDRLLRVRENDE